ncbi:hypothetical protein BSL84_34420 [Streptomyces sp. TN58]|nr:hypothetical protein BSL84_00085 [Streptomyces sp. TN58]APU44040.1 hypothetical protein BSL84_34420 [Streptomyces sp. TN58]
MRLCLVAPWWRDAPGRTAEELLAVADEYREVTTKSAQVTRLPPDPARCGPAGAPPTSGGRTPPGGAGGGRR